MSNSPRWQFRFSLASAMLTMVVISMCLALARVHLETGVLVSFLTIPALIRTVLVATREARAKNPLSALGKILEFLFSWVLMLPIGLAALVVGVIAFMLVSLASYIVMEMFHSPLGFRLPPQVELVFVTYSFTAAIGTGGLILAWGISSSLTYRPVVKI